MSDWYLSQLARQDQYGETPPANWPVPQMPEQDAFEAAAARVRAPYRNAAPVGARIGQLAEQVTSMPSWADVATQQMNKDKEAFQTGGIGSLLADTSVAQELAGGFGGTTKAVGKPVIGELASPFYSAAGRAVENAKLGKGTADQWLGYLRNQPGVKPEELQYVFGNLPEGQLTKAQMQAHAAENAVTLGEVNKGGNISDAKVKEYHDISNSVWNRASEEQRTELRNEFLRNEGLTEGASPTKYSQWQLPGGENYRETLLTLPSEMPKEMIAARDRVTLLERQTTDQMAEWKALAESRPPGDPETLAAYQRLANSRRELGAADELAGRLSNQRADATFKSSHWDEPNVLAHVRTNDREIPGVGKSLHVEEIQSDWHQKGRSSGYQTNKTPTADDVELKFIKGNPPADAVDKSVYPGYWESIDKSDGSMIGRHRGDMTEAEALAQAIGDLKHKARNTGVPDAPFKSTWADVALKRQIREASEKGYDAISWTPGEAQAARYDLSTQVDSILHKKNPDGTYQVSAQVGGRGQLLGGGRLSEAELSDHVGKEVAQKIIDNEGKRINLGGNSTSQPPDYMNQLSGLDLKIGGEGMHGFYDKMLVDKANAIGKKHGARVEQSEIETQVPQPHRRDLTETRSEPVHVLRITPELRAAAMKGFPLFTAGGLVVGGAMGELARQDKYGRNE